MKEMALFLKSTKGAGCHGLSPATPLTRQDKLRDIMRKVADLDSKHR
jgi:hypothetical protein